MASAKWSVTLLDGISVARPGGLAVPLPTRKSAAILAILVVAEGRLVPRARMAEILWPHSPAAQRSQSLRTELATLREALGSQSPLAITRATCRLPSETVRSDYPPATVEDYTRLAPEMSEPWFRDLRRGRTGNLEKGETVRPASDPEPDALFHRLLQWSLDENPDCTLDLMRASPDLACSLLPAELDAICDRIRGYIGPAHSSYGWLRFFQGFAMCGLGNYVARFTILHQASEWAAERKDTRLFADALLWETACLIVTGRAELAAKRAERAMSFVDGSDARAIARIRHAQGLASHHCGRFRDGDALFLAALDSPFYQSTLIERANLLSHIALFRATNEDVKGASAMTHEITQICGPFLSWHLKGSLLLTKTLMYLAEGEREAAEKDLTQLSHHAQLLGSPDLTIYAEETLARLRLESSDRTSAIKHLRKGVQRRKETNMGLTPWDQTRLKPVLAALERS